MAYTAVPDSKCTVGYEWLAADNNTYIRDNFMASVPDIFTTKGDIAVATTADAMSRLGVGANDTLLVADSAQTTGLKWGNTSGMARYGRATTQSISDSTVTIIDFATSVYDVCSAVTTGASWKYTAPVAGYYLVSANVTFQASASWGGGEYAYMRLYKNNAAVQYMAYKYSTAAGTFRYHLTGQAFIYLALSTDYIDVRVYQNSGAALTVNNDAAKTHVEIARLF